MNNRALLPIMAACLATNTPYHPLEDFSLGFPNGPTEHYSKRPENKAEYYTDEKGNIRRRKKYE